MHAYTTSIQIEHAGIVYKQEVSYTSDVSDNGLSEQIRAMAYRLPWRYYAARDESEPPIWEELSYKDAPPWIRAIFARHVYEYGVMMGFVFSDYHTLDAMMDMDSSQWEKSRRRGV